MSVLFLVLFAFSTFYIPSSKGDITFLQQPNELQMMPPLSKALIPCVVNAAVTKCNWYLNSKLYKLDRKAKMEGNVTEGNCSLTITGPAMKFNGTCFCEVFTEDGDSANSTKGEIYITKKPAIVQIKLVHNEKEISTPYLLVPPNEKEVEILITSTGAAPPETENLIVTVDDNPLNVEYNVSYEDRVIKGRIRVPTNSIVLVKHQHSLSSPASIPFSILVTTSQPKLYGDRVAIPKNSRFPLTLRGVPVSASGSKIIFQVTNETGETVKLTSNNELPTEMVTGSKSYNVTLKQNFPLFGEIMYSVPLEIFRYDAMTKVEITSPGNVTLTPENKSATLECKADGEPQPEIHWLRYTGTSIDIYRNGSPINVSETGIYKCAALQKILEQERLKEAITVVKVQ